MNSHFLEIEVGGGGGWGRGGARGQPTGNDNLEKWRQNFLSKTNNCAPTSEEVKGQHHTAGRTTAEWDRIISIGGGGGAGVESGSR